MKCSVCEKEASFTFLTLSVRTLKIRDADREKRVQALGSFQEYAVCRDCTEKKYQWLTSIPAQVFPGILIFTAILLAGVLIALFFGKEDRVFLITGISAILCGIIGFTASFKTAFENRRRFSSLTKDDALPQAAYLALLDSLPKKEGDNDLSYIPVTKETLSMKNGDLMLAYDLLPQIAMEAHKLIHKKRSANLQLLQ